MSTVANSSFNSFRRLIFAKTITGEVLVSARALQGGKVLGFYWTLGRYDTVTIVEGTDEKTAMKSLLTFADLVSTETLVAITAEEASKLVE